MKDFETPPPAAENPEKEHLFSTVELRDAKGELLGEMDIEYGDVVETKAGEGRRLEGLMVRGEKDGEPTEFDVLEACNPHGITVAVSAERSGGYHYDDEGARSLVAPLETVFDVATLLHELGHADQYKDKRFDELKHLYGARSKAFLEHDQLMEQIEAVVKAVPEAEDIMDRKVLATHDELQKKYSDLLAKRDKLSERAKLLEEDPDELYEVQEQYRDAMSAVVGVFNKSNADAVLRLPTRVMERDATRRALQWMRKIRQETGVDLFSPAVSPDERSVRKQECTSSLSAGLNKPAETAKETTVVEDLRRSLKSYRADKFRYKKPGEEDGIGVVPRV